MITRQPRTNRSSFSTTLTKTPTVVHYLSIIYIFSSLFTIALAVQQNDNEAIIQLSVDSIHVVKSSDSRFTHFEDNINDNDERQLLIALLTSFDDEDWISNSINARERLSHETKSDTASTSSMDNSSSSLVRGKTVAKASLRFVPELLDFTEQPISMPKMQTVIIINEQNEPVELQSLSGTTVNFYSSFFAHKQLSANGGNTTIHVYFLPRTLGATMSTFTIQTNLGTLQYSVRGIGTPNPFRLRPLIGATIPFNSTFEYSVNFYNPYNHTLQIEEIYTSDENLILELLSYRSYRNHIRSNTENHDQWHFEPFQNKTIIKIHYLAYKTDRLHGFYCIKTNRNDTIIVPVEINVADNLGLYSNVDTLEFTTDGYVRSMDEAITVPIYVTNNGNDPVIISDTHVTTGSSGYLTIDYKDVEVPADIHRLTKVAELTLHPSRVPKNIDTIYGTVKIFATEINRTPSTSTNLSILDISFHTTILHGSLDLTQNSNTILVPSLLKDKFDETKQICRPIYLINQFNVPLMIFNVSIDKLDIMSGFIKFKFTPGFIAIHPQQTVSPFCVLITRRTSPSMIFLNMETILTVHTNLSYFHMPLHFYSGLLSLTLINDHRNGGIRLNESNPSEFIIASIPIHTSRTVHFAITNNNPIDVPIEKLRKLPANSIIQVCELRAMNGTVINTGNQSLNNDGVLPLLTIPGGFQALISITISAGDQVGSLHEVLTFQTPYQLLTMNIKYAVITHPFEVNDNNQLRMDAFTNRISTLDLYLQNHFDVEIDMKRIDFPTFGKCFSFLWNNSATNKLTIKSKQYYKIGRLSFDMNPLCSNIQLPTISKPHCGLNFHAEFNSRWEKCVATLGTQNIDYDLVTEFRNLWKEWMTIIRKHRLELNVWIGTDLGDISLPMTINFIWPSVLEHMWSSLVSRSPIIMDFHLVLVNTTKTQNVIINNPSPIPLSYTVELIPNYAKRTKSKQGFIDTAFSIIDGSKIGEFNDSVYKFVLQPKEHLILTINYQPKLSTKDEEYLSIRNELTILESILLRGEGASGSLTVGNRKAGSSDVPLVIEMTDRETEFCTSRDSEADRKILNPVLRKIVTLRNTGNIKILINEILFGNSKCFGRGFSVSTCTNIEIEPGEHYELKLGYQPDYTLAEIRDNLILNTNIGSMSFPLIVRIPQRILTSCYNFLPRPNWESRTSFLCILSIPLFLILIISSAISDARRVFHKYLAIFELRLRNLTPDIQNIRPADLATGTNLSKASVISSQLNDTQVQGSPTHIKKDTYTHDSKAKNTDTKGKRSTTSNNGMKENLESGAKTTRNSDANISSVRTVSSPKASSAKNRRVTTENFSTKVNKQDGETSASTPSKSSTNNKITKLSTAQSTSNSYVHSSTPTTGLTPTSLSDDEDEPFQLARTKRVTSKAKDSMSTSIQVKAPNNIEDSSLKKPSPPTPNLLSSVISSSKVLPKADLNDHQQTPTNVSQFELHGEKEITTSNYGVSDSRSSVTASNHEARKPLTPTNSQREQKVDETQVNTRSNKNNRNNEVSSAEHENDFHDEEIQANLEKVLIENKNQVDWDEPSTPDLDFSRYVSQTEELTDETNDIDEWDSSKLSSVNDTSSPMELKKEAVTKLLVQESETLMNIFPMNASERFEAAPVPHHVPGPIQRPNKLSTTTTTQQNQLFAMNSMGQTPISPDVLDQINQLIYEPSSPVLDHPMKSSSHMSPNSPMMGDLNSQETNWTSFMSSEWPSKTEPSWLLGTLSSPPISINQPPQNPFAILSPMNSNQQQMSQNDSSFWSTVLNPGTQRFPTQSIRPPNQQQWNGMFPNSPMGMGDLNNANSNRWPRMWSVPDSPSNDGNLLNARQTASTNAQWNLQNLAADSVVPSINRSPGQASSNWWPTTLSDENNNKNASNHDSFASRDQSRWDFAR